MEQLKYKAVHFDLHIKSLEKYYSARNPKGAYGKIQTYMEQNGFEHRQYSGYLSKAKISDIAMDTIISDMASKFPWLPHCARKLEVTNVGKKFDYMPFLNKNKRKVNERVSKPLKDAQRKIEKTKLEKPTRKVIDLQR